MRYYVYISDAKVDMLLPQVPGALQKKVAAKLGFDIHILKGEIATERATLETRVARLSAVENHINSTQQVGTLDDPQPWISGEAAAKIVRLQENTNVVFFIIETSHTIIAMGGSSKHLTSEVESEGIESGYSFTPTLLREFEREIVDRPNFLAFPSNFKVLSERIQPGGMTQWTQLVYDAARQIGGVDIVQSISFLAKRLLEEDYLGKRVILGTPLYVSLAE